MKALGACAVAISLVGSAAIALFGGCHEAPPRAPAPQPTNAATVSPKPTSIPTASKRPPRANTTRRPAPPRWVALCQRGSGRPGACREAAPVEAPCPAEIGKARGYCGIAGKTPTNTCVFPEGRCTCKTTPYCGGPAPSFFMTSAMAWHCKLIPGPGECPGQATNGAACGKDGLRCDYSTCLLSKTCSCEAGTWRCQEEHLPPQP